MGAQKTLSQADSVSKMIGDLGKLASDPKKNLTEINSLLSQLRVDRMTAAQRVILEPIEKSIYDKLNPSDRVKLYTFKLPSDLTAVDVTTIKNKDQAITAMRECAKDPHLYLPQIQWLFYEYGKEIKKAAPDLPDAIYNKLLSASRLDFLRSEPYVAPKLASESLDELSEMTGRERQAEMLKGAPKKMIAQPTEQRLLPSEARMLSTPVLVPELPANVKFVDRLGASTGETMTRADRDMFLNYFKNAKKPDGVSGNIWYNALIGSIGWTVIDQPKVDADTATGYDPRKDARWRKLAELTAMDMSTTEGRQKMLDILGNFKKGDFFNGLKGLPNNSILKLAVAEDIGSITKKMTGLFPVFAFTIGGMEGYHFKSGKFTLELHAFATLITSQEYGVEFNPNTYELSFKPKGYTGKQMLTRVGATGQYKFTPFIQLQMDVAAEIPQGITEEGKASFTGKPQALIELSFTDASGKLRILNAPIYYGLRASYRAPSNSLNVTGAVGVGIARLKGLGPVVAMVDVGWEVMPGDQAYPRPISNLIARAGIGFTPVSKATGETMPFKIYGLGSMSGEPTLLGLRTDYTAGAGAEARLWYGTRISVEGRYRKASVVSGLPISGPGNAMVLVNVDLSELLHKAIHRRR